MIDPKELPALTALDALGIAYTRVEHPLALTMADCDAVDAGVGARHCKNLFLTNRQKTEFYLVLIEGEKKFKTAAVSKTLGVSRLSFGTPELLMEKLGILPGSVTPLGLVHENARDVTVVVDEDVTRFPMVCVHPLVSTASLAMSGADLMRFLQSTGNEICIIPIAQEEA